MKILFYLLIILFASLWLRAHAEDHTIQVCAKYRHGFVERVIQMDAAEIKEKCDKIGGEIVDQASVEIGMSEEAVYDAEQDKAD